MNYIELNFLETEVSEKANGLRHVFDIRHEDERRYQPPRMKAIPFKADVEAWSAISA